MNPKTIKFQEKLDAKHGKGRLIILSEYEKNNIKVLIKCAKCSYEFNVLPMQLTRKLPTGCPSCSGNIKKTTDIFAGEVRDLVGDEYMIQSEYINTHTKIKLLHKNCGSVIDISPNDFLNGTRCRYCQHPSVRKNESKFNEEIEKRFNGEYTVIGKYTTSKDPIEFKHTTCGRIFTKKPVDILHQNNPCIFCNGRGRTTKSLSEDIERVSNNEYSLKSEYVNSDEKVTLLHHMCNKTYSVRAYNFLRGDRCPFCNNINISKGVRTIRGILTDLNIPFDERKISEKCVYKKRMEFDFLIPNHNLIIEYDGSQHFKAKFGKTTFTEQRNRDTFKNEWCEKNHVKLLRLSYKNSDEDIFKILVDLLVDDKFNDYSREGSTIQAYWKQEVNFYYK